MNDSHFAVTRSFVIMASTTLVVAIVAIVKEAVVAQNFGASEELDAFVFSSSVAYFVPTLLAITLQGTFVPIFYEALKVDARRGWLFASVTLTILWMVMVACTILLWLGGHFLIAVMVPGFQKSGQTLALLLLWTLLPTVILSGVNEQLKNTLNALKVFGLPSFVQIIPSITSIVTIVLWKGPWGIYAFAIGWNVGLFAQTVILAWGLKVKGGVYVPRVDCSQREFARLITQGAPYLIVPLSSLGILFVDKYFASYLGTGAISYFNYAEKLFRVPWMIIAAALFTTALPYFSEQLARSRVELREAISLTVRLAAFLTIPVVVVMSVLSQPLTAVLFERGSFTSQDTSGTAIVLVGFMASLFLYTVTFILDRGLCVLGATTMLMNLALATFVLKVLCAWVMTQVWGLQGLALSTAPVLALQGLGMYLMLTRLLGRFDLSGLIGCLGKTIFASAAMAVPLLAIWHHGSVFAGLMRDNVPNTIVLVLAITVGALAYWLTAIGMKSAEASALLKVLWGRGQVKGVLK